MQYTVYQITNQVNGKIYIGCHQTNNPDDSYMGSGKIIKRAIAKYGLENFTKTVLATFDSQEQMFEEEKNLISTLCPEYNLHPGGNGGFQYINSGSLRRGFEHMPPERLAEISKRASIKGCASHSHKLKTDPAYRERVSRAVSAGLVGKPNGFTGKRHSDETKKRLSEAKRGMGTGEAGSQYGKMWVTNGTHSISMFRDQPIPEGYRPGRVNGNKKYKST